MVGLSNGEVVYGNLHTSLGELVLQHEDCVNEVQIRAREGWVQLVLHMNHKSEDVKMTMEAAFSPNEAERLANSLEHWAMVARGQRQS